MTPNPTLRRAHADCALTFVHFLERVIQDVWDRYGHDMQTLLIEQAEAYRAAAHAASQDTRRNAELPF